MANVTNKFCGKCGAALENGVCPNCKPTGNATEKHTVDAPSSEKGEATSSKPATGNTVSENEQKPYEGTPDTQYNANGNSAAVNKSGANKSNSGGGKKKLNPLWWVVAVLAVILVLLVLHATKAINIPFLNPDTYLTFDNDEISSDEEEDEEDEDTDKDEATPTPDTSTPVETFAPDADLDVKEYYNQNGSIVLQADASTTADVMTEAEATAELQSRGFTTDKIYTDCTIDGKFTDDTVISDNVTTTHPYYYTTYTSANGELWTVYIMGKQVSAIPVTYIAEYNPSFEIAVVAEEYTTCYDHATNTFFNVIPKSSALMLINVENVNAEALDNLTKGEISSRVR